MDWIDSIKARIEAGEDYLVTFGQLRYCVEPRPHGRLFVWFTHMSAGIEYRSLIAREKNVGAAAARIVNHRDSMAT